MFPKGVDYIFTMTCVLGVSVSSLYGAPLKLRGSHGVNIAVWSFSLHRYPDKFQSSFR